MGSKLASVLASAGLTAFVRDIKPTQTTTTETAAPSTIAANPITESTMSAIAAVDAKSPHVLTNNFQSYGYISKEYTVCRKGKNNAVGVT